MTARGLNPSELTAAADVHGLVHRGCGVPPRTLSGWCERGLTTRLLPGVYCLPSLAQDFETMVRAVPVWSPDAVVTGVAAARTLFQHDANWRPVQVIARSRLTAPGYRMVWHRLPPEQVVERGDVRFTSAAWTAVWLAAWDDGAALDAALRSGLTAAALDEAHEQMKGFVGATRRREVVRWSRLKPWSQLERAVHRILVDAGITGWQGNWPYRSRSGKLYVLDIAFIAQRVAIEVDGYGVHGTREAWRRDMHKTNDLILDGWLVLHFSWADLADPTHMVEQIRRALRTAA